MNKEKLEQILRTLKSPAFLIGVFVVVGIFLNVYFVMLFVAPSFKEHAASDAAYRSLLLQKEAADKQPFPVKVTGAQVETLIKQVPTQDDLARFLSNLNDMEKASGVKLLTVQFGEAARGANGLEELLSNAAKKNNPGQNIQTNSTAPNAGNSGQNQSGGNPSTSAVTEEMKMSLSIQGSYEQIISFMNKIDLNDRLVTIRDWSVQTAATNKGKAPETALGPKTAPAVPANDSLIVDNINVVLNISLYSAKQYAGKFKDLPPLQPKEVDRRVDPTWTEQQFLKMLEANK